MSKRNTAKTTRHPMTVAEEDWSGRRYLLGESVARRVSEGMGCVRESR